VTKDGEAYCDEREKETNEHVGEDDVAAVSRALEKQVRGRA